MPEFPTDGPTAYHRERLAAGEFLIQSCEDCQAPIFYTRIVCPECGSNSLSWIRPSGRGTIYAKSIVNRPESKGGPYNVVLVDLEERVRLMSTVVDAGADEIAIGSEVILEVQDVDGEPAPVFRLASEVAGR